MLNKFGGFYIIHSSSCLLPNRCECTQQQKHTQTHHHRSKVIRVSKGVIVCARLCGWWRWWNVSLYASKHNRHLSIEHSAIRGINGSFHYQRRPTDRYKKTYYNRIKFACHTFWFNGRDYQYILIYRHFAPPIVHLAGAFYIFVSISMDPYNSLWYLEFLCVSLTFRTALRQIEYFGFWKTKTRHNWNNQNLIQAL